ncbi:hypothetical protein DCE93_00225 [Agromyces badenianii]|uniref:Alpha/beta hydrolase fold-3 domain-containing protein n=1 Tax=Agromyces badenianii TaxID=2080742 RepID=A0A2S0WSJ7_9MICO|nr:alpha/beta hydrolase [Agromyces badenianii]AWB94292.1 hypothetical protein DCE93_00225 [Agromyces badenianii]
MVERRVHGVPPSDEFLRLRRTLEVPTPTPTPMPSPPTQLGDERWSFRVWAARLPVAREVVVEPTTEMPEPGSEWIRPTRPASRRDVILYLHGGGFRVGSPATARSITSHLAVASGLEIASAAYPLAPEATMDEMVASVTRSYRALRTLRPDARVVLAGDSAGGYLALALLDQLALQGEPRPAAVVLFCPLTTLDARADERREVRDPMLSEAMLTSVRRDVRRPRRPRQARPGAPALLPPWPGRAVPRRTAATVGAASLSGVPLLVQYGGHELLASSIEAFAEQAPDHAPVVVEEWRHAFHVWQLFAGLLPESDAAIASASAFLRDALG